ncbi:hypothetical protein IscW_ISCW021194 [Ixodes scapularis]|uniref:Uncharacterized protein n=1 Tax=Ixodes scapularis TaxID=6945 RepID=B7Q9D5_IXOSC|nr:hypothetical protein IscW_ISCW021194 [Ixodes scapularis]|eukprot:XP_002405781.1 hypothetical protein IscW_ISCW021194 [Ixodes scapularis]
MEASALGRHPGYRRCLLMTLPAAGHPTTWTRGNSPSSDNGRPLNYHRAEHSQDHTVSK